MRPWNGVLDQKGEQQNTPQCDCPCARGQNQFWPVQPRAIPTKFGYVTGGTPGCPRSSNPSLPTFFTMPIPPKSIPGENGIFFCVPSRERTWAKSVLTNRAQGHSSQIWVCHRGYPCSYFCLGPRGSIGAMGTCRASFFVTSPSLPLFAPPPPSPPHQTI